MRTHGQKTDAKLVHSSREGSQRMERTWWPTRGLTVRGIILVKSLSWPNRTKQDWYTRYNKPKVN